MEFSPGFIRLAKAAGLLAFLAACSGTGPEPYLLANWKTGEESDYAVASYAPQKGPNGKPTLSICYSKMRHSIEDIRRLVTANCTDPGLMDNRIDLYACSVTAPVRATFSCDRLSREASEGRPNLGPAGTFTGTINLY